MTQRLNLATRLALGATTLVALSLVTACDSDFDEPGLGMSDDEALRSGTYTFPSYDVNVNPTSGRRLNTNSVGAWEFSNLFLDPSSPVPSQSVRLVGVETGTFVQNMPWETDNIFAGAPVDVSSLVLDAHMLTGHSSVGDSLRHADFHGSIWTVKVDAGTLNHWQAVGEGVKHTVVEEQGVQYGLVQLHLSVGWSTLPNSADQPDSNGDEDQWEVDYANAGAVPLYTFRYEKDGRNGDDATGWFETCSVPQGAGVHSTATVLLDDLHVDEANGSISHSADSLYLGCVVGAVGKAATWGYWHDELMASTYPQSSLTNFETVVRMVRADYCGDGTSYTSEGTAIGIADRVGVINPTPDLLTKPSGDFEAVWYAGGADCVNNIRDPGWGSLHCWRPTCDSLDPAGTYSYFEWPAYTHFLTWRW